jgi:hypothetical protein
MCIFFYSLYENKVVLDVEHSLYENKVVLDVEHHDLVLIVFFLR